MRILAGLLGLGALAFGLLWVGLVALAQGPGARALGGDVAVSGFPARFALSTTELRLQSADGRMGWQGAGVAVSAPVWDPLTMTIELPAEQALVVRGVPITLRADAAGATLGLSFGADVPIRQAALALTPVEMAALGLTHRAQSLRATLAQDTGGVQLSVETTALALDPMLRGLLDPGASLPAQLERVALDAVLSLSAPLALRGTVPRVQAIDVQAAQLRWGKIAIDATAALARDGAQTFAGTLTLRVTGWPELLALLVRVGVVGPDMVPLAQGMAAGMTDPATGILTLPLEMRASRLWLGPFGLGQLPPL